MLRSFTGAEHEGRSGFEETLPDVLAEADQAHREVLWRRLLGLPDVERRSSS